MMSEHAVMQMRCGIFGGTPSPLGGEGWGEGANDSRQAATSTRLAALATLPRKRGREGARGPATAR